MIRMPGMFQIELTEAETWRSANFKTPRRSALPSSISSHLSRWLAKPRLPAIMKPSYPLLYFIVGSLVVQYTQGQGPRLGAEKCAGIVEGRGCLSPGGRLCCEEDFVNVISCDKKTKKIKYFHCTGGRICAPDGKGDIACFVPGTQPKPPS
jgi:hypothetical protein